MSTESSERQGSRPWRRHFESRLVTPEEVVGRMGEPPGVELRALGIWRDFGLQHAPVAEAIRGNMSFGTPTRKDAIANGIVQFMAAGFGDIHRNIDQRPPAAPRTVSAGWAPHLRTRPASAASAPSSGTSGTH